jgi:anti-anti-sigma factor
VVPLPFAMFVGEHDGVLAVRLAGRLEEPWTDEVHRELVSRSPSSLRLDVSALSAIDSAGLHALVALRQDVVSGGGRFVILGGRGAVRSSFAVAGLDALVDDEPEEPVAARPIGHVHLAQKGGRDARRSATSTPKVA